MFIGSRCSNILAGIFKNQPSCFDCSSGRVVCGGGSRKIHGGSETKECGAREGREFRSRSDNSPHKHQSMYDLKCKVIEAINMCVWWFVYFLDGCFLETMIFDEFERSVCVCWGGG